MEERLPTASPAPTEQDSATWESWPRFQERCPDSNDFARLVPYSTEAKLAFRHQVQRMLQDESFPDFSKPFIYWEFAAPEISQVEDTEPSSIGEEDIAGGEPSIHTPNQPNLPEVTGFYRLNMTDPSPAQPCGIGWHAGTGRARQEVHFILAYKGREPRLHGKHVRIQRLLETGTLLAISMGRRFSVDGFLLERKPPGSNQDIGDYQRILSDNSNLAVGSLVYQVKLLKVDEDVEMEQMQQAWQSSSRTDEAQFWLPPTESDGTNLIVLDQYMIHPAFATGSYGEVHYAIHRVSGKKFVVKRQTASGPDAVSAVKNEVDMLRACVHPNICKIEDFYEPRVTYGAIPPKSTVSHTFLVLSPAAMYTLKHSWTLRDGPRISLRNQYMQWSLCFSASFWIRSPRRLYIFMSKVSCTATSNLKTSASSTIPLTVSNDTSVSACSC